MKVVGKVQIWSLVCLFSLSQSTEAIYTTALPSIAQYFNITENLAQLSSAVYFVGFAMGIFCLGRVSDVFGRRPVVIFGILLYSVSSLILSLNQSVFLLIFLRFVQAFGASVGSVIAQAMARDSYQGAELSSVYATVSIFSMCTPSASSVIGGYMVEYTQWNYIFVLLMFVSLFLCTLYYLYLPETNPYIGVSQKNPYFRVLKVVLCDKTVLLYSFIVGVYTGMIFGLYIEAPFVFIDKLEMLPSTYGKLGFLLTIASLVGSIISRYLLKIGISTQKIIIFGLILSLVGCCLLNLSLFIPLKPEYKVWIIIVVFIPLMIQMISHSFVMPMALRYALEDYYKVTGTAGSIFGSLYYAVVAIIVFTVSKLHASSSIAKFTLLFLMLSVSSIIAFYLIQKLRHSRKYEFA